MKDPREWILNVITRSAFKLKEITIYGRMTERYFEMGVYPPVKVLDMRDLELGPKS